MSPTTADVVAAVRAICLRATAHNYGQTTWEIDITPDGLMVHMSSWPRAKEATQALRDAGYAAQQDDDCCVLVTAVPA